MPLQKTAPATADDLLRLRVDGWCLVEDVIPETQVEDVRESVLRTVSSREYREDRNFLAHNSDFVRYVAEPRILAILEALWGPFHRVGWTGPTFRHPGDVREQWHVDWPFGRRPAAGILPPFPDAVMYLTSIWMLSPFLPDSGSTIIAPGTHRSGDRSGDGRHDRRHCTARDRDAGVGGRGQRHIAGQPAMARQSGLRWHRTSGSHAGVLRPVVAQSAADRSRVAGGHPDGRGVRRHRGTAHAPDFYGDLR